MEIKKRLLEEIEFLEEDIVDKAALAGAAIFAGIIANTIRKALTTAGRKCLKYQGPAKKVCLAKYKREGYLQAIQKLKSKQSVCAKAKDPQKCKATLNKKIQQLQTKANSIVVPQAESFKQELEDEKMSHILERVLRKIQNIEEAEGMEGLPKGWDQSSVKKFAKSLTGKGAPEKGFFDKCVEKMKGKIDDPKSFCAAVKDEVEGSTYWRGKGKTEKEAEKQTAQKQNVKQD